MNGYLISTTSCFSISVMAYCSVGLGLGVKKNFEAKTLDMRPIMM